MQNKIKKINVIINNKSIKSKQYDEFYFHSEDGIGESNYVFINSNNLKKRFKLSNKFIIAELGFGSGLNFLNTWKLWLKEKKENAFLNYISFERQPLSKYQLNKILKKFGAFDNFTNLFIRKLPLRTTGIHEIFFEIGNVNLTLIYNNFDYIKNLNFEADTWFLDGFSPSKNKSAWSSELMKHVFNKTKPEGTFSTFTSSSKVQKNLKSVGFKIFKKKGFKQKREMIFGFKQKYINSFFYKTNDIKNQLEPVAIIGSGVSGCSLAYALKKRGMNCFIIEKKNLLGDGASGNLLALQLPKLTLDNSTLGIFSLRSYFYSRGLAKNLHCAPVTDGVLVSPSREREIVKFEKLLLNNWSKKLFQKYEGHFNIDSKILHLYPNAGIVNTKKFLNKLSEKIKVFYNFEVRDVYEEGDQKKIINQHGEILKAKSIIWANGYEMAQKLKNNLIVPVSGQVTYLNENNNTKDIKMNFSYGNFFSQSYFGLHQIGATFSRENFLPCKDNDLKNINNLPNFLKKIFNFSNNNEFKSRFSIRASTKERLPFFGSLGDLREYYLGGMGSWGFIYAPFLAEILIRKILYEPIFLEDFVLSSLDLERRI